MALSFSSRSAQVAAHPLKNRNTSSSTEIEPRGERKGSCPRGYGQESLFCIFIWVVSL